MTEYAQKRIVGLEVKNAERGEVVAIVSVFDVLDRDGDVVLSGAIPDGVPVKLSGYNHDIITEGKAPAGRGVVRVVGNKAVFEGQYFMKTQRGQEAFEVVKELGPDSEWSIGYLPRVRTAPMTKEWAALGAKRLIAGLDLLEVSPVFVASNPQTSTVGTKSPTSDELHELDAIAHANAQREALILEAAFKAIVHDHEPAPGAHLIPPVVRERLDEVAEYTREVLDLPGLEVRFYQPAPGETRYGFRRKSRPNVAYVAIGKPAEQMALTIAHEAMHVAGYVTEGATEYGAELIVKGWEDRQARVSPYGFPIDLYDRAPTVGSCGMFPPTGGL